MPNRFLLPLAQASVALLATALPLAAQTDAISGTYTGNQTWTGTLSQEFTVRPGAGIRITRFGAFDDRGDGFAAPITVRLWDAAAGTQVGETITFSGDVGTAVGSFRFVELANPIVLAAGFVGRIGASGYGSDAERYYNAHFNGSQMVELKGAGRLNFGRVYYAEDAGFPNAPSGTSEGGWYGSASFTFAEATSTVPEPATWATLGGGLLVLGALRRRQTRQA